MKKKSHSILATSWGFVAAVWTEDGLWELSFPKPDAETAIAGLTSSDIGECSEDNLHLEGLQQELNQYFRGFPTNFTVPVDWSGYTPFQAAALQFCAAIPYGQTDTYGGIAAAIGSPAAARAIGGAMHGNRTPIVVPCHRVVGSTGSLTGFGGGLDLKRALLLMEQEGSLATE